jgi:hypothetical protein
MYHELQVTWEEVVAAYLQALKSTAREINHDKENIPDSKDKCRAFLLQ